MTGVLDLQRDERRHGYLIRCAPSNRVAKERGRKSDTGRSKKREGEGPGERERHRPWTGSGNGSN